MIISSWISRLLSGAAVLVGYVMCVGDDCPGGESCHAKKPVKCYECSTVNKQYYCGDPMNTTVRGIQTVQCEEACVKWVRRPKSGPTHIIRTCASSINLKMQWSYICMKESRPGNGRLCLCNEDFCNSGISWKNPRNHHSVLLYLCLLSFLLMNNIKLEHFNSVTWIVTSPVCILIHYLTFFMCTGNVNSIIRPLVSQVHCKVRKNDTKDSNTG